ncbi:MAG: ethanolamine ammonia-lyase subunit EutC [Clostridia bacterium]|nr:ethanolamine ammonia-lyase subunit EutC [Clostridia bacterium]
MIDEKLVQLITEEVIRQLAATGRVRLPGKEGSFVPQLVEDEDLASPAAKAKTLVEDPEDPEALARMKKRTTARIGVGNCGPRLNTRTLLTLRADHAAARDAVFKDVDPALIERLGLVSVETQCDCKNTYVTRPDLGRKLSEEAVETLRARCTAAPDVQIFAADGLSSTAIESNLERILPVLTDGLKAKGLKVGTPFYLRYGRVASEDHVSEVLGAKVVCVLIGERPGLATAESMSAYIVYNAYVGMPESKRTVVSNIHRNGLTAVEAGAYIVEVIGQILEKKASGVDLVK